MKGREDSNCQYWNLRGDIKKIRHYYDQLIFNKFNNKNKINILFKRHKLLKLTK